MHKSILLHGYTCLSVFFKDCFWFPCREDVLICPWASSSVTFLHPHNGSVWILEMCDWRTLCLLYLVLSQTRRVEINRFFSLSSGRPNSALLNILTCKTRLHHVCTFFLREECVCCSYGSFRHPLTQEESKQSQLVIISAKFVHCGSAMSRTVGVRSVM